MRNDYVETKQELDRYRSFFREAQPRPGNESSCFIYDPVEENYKSQNPWQSKDLRQYAA
jgi:hypothetical protein